MLKNVESPATTINRQMALINDTDTGGAGMSLEQLNEYLVKRSAVICEYVRKERKKYRSGKVSHTTDVIPPICYINTTLQDNIKNVSSCFSNTLGAALFCESQYIKVFEDFEALSSIVKAEKYLIFDFLSENGLTGKFNEFVKQKSTNE